MHTVHFTKTNLSKLLLDVEDGKQVVIGRGKKPIARMVPCAQLPNDSRPEVGTVTSKAIKIAFFCICIMINLIYFNFTI